MKITILLLVMGLSSSQCFAEEAEVKPAPEDSIKLSTYDWRYAPYVSYLNFANFTRSASDRNA